METTPYTTTTELASAWVVPLPSGAHGAVIATATYGDVVLALLLTAVLALLIVQLWRTRRTG